MKSTCGSVWPTLASKLNGSWPYNSLSRVFVAASRCAVASCEDGPARCDRLHVATPQADATNRMARDRKDFLEVHQRMRFIVMSVLLTGNIQTTKVAPHADGITRGVSLTGKWGNDGRKDENFGTLIAVFKNTLAEGCPQSFPETEGFQSVVQDVSKMVFSS